MPIYAVILYTFKVLRHEMGRQHRQSGGSFMSRSALHAQSVHIKGGKKATAPSALHAEF